FEPGGVGSDVDERLTEGQGVHLLCIHSPSSPVYGGSTWPVPRRFRTHPTDVEDAVMRGRMGGEIPPTQGTPHDRSNLPGPLDRRCPYHRRGRQEQGLP